MQTKIKREGIFTVGLKYWPNFQKDQILFLAKVEILTKKCNTPNGTKLIHCADINVCDKYSDVS